MLPSRVSNAFGLALRYSGGCQWRRGGGVSGQVMHLQGSAHTWNRPALTQMKQSSGLVFSEKAV